MHNYLRPLPVLVCREGENRINDFGNLISLVINNCLIIRPSQHPYFRYLTIIIKYIMLSMTTGPAKYLVIWTYQGYICVFKIYYYCGLAHFLNWLA